MFILFLASCTQVFVIYQILLSFLLNFYHPVYQYELYIPQGQRLLHPEIDLPIYVISWIVVLIGGTVLYRWLKKHTIHLPSQDQKNAVYLFFSRSLIVLAIATIFIEDWPWKLLLVFFKDPLAELLYFVPWIKMLSLPIISVIVFPFYRSMYFGFTKTTSKQLIRMVDAHKKAWTCIAWMVVITPLLIGIFKFAIIEKIIYRLMQRLYFSPLLITISAWKILIAWLVSLLWLLWLQKPITFRPNKMLERIFTIGVIVLLGWLATRTLTVNEYDFNYYIGPINDILHGKDILVNAQLQYGLLVAYFIALIFRSIIPLSFYNFAIINYFFYVVGYSIIFVALRKWIRDYRILIPLFILIIEQHFFVQAGAGYMFPQTGFIRFGLWIPLFFWYAYNLYDVVNPLSAVILAVGALFWGFDSGMYIVAAFCITEAIRLQNKQKLVNFAVRLFTVFLLYLAGISLMIYARSGVFPSWKTYFYDSFLYLGGIGMIPMGFFDIHSVFLLCYGITTVYCIYHIFFQRSGEKLRSFLPLVFINSYGISQFIYYVGRSHDNNLHHVSIPFFLVIAWWIKKLATENMQPFLHYQTQAIVALFFGIFLLFGTEETVLRIHNRVPFTDPFKTDDLTELQTVVESKTNKTVIVSCHDVHYLSRFNKTNGINVSNLQYFLTAAAMKKIAEEIKSSGEVYILIDPSIPHSEICEQVDIIKSLLEGTYQEDGPIGPLILMKKVEAQEFNPRDELPQKISP